MVNTTFHLALTRSMEEAPRSAPPLERWLDRARELQRELSRQVLSLSRYVDELPKSSYASYADALVSSLQDPELETKVDEMRDLKSRVQEFARRLEVHGYADKAALVRKAVDQISRPNK